jgi:hypothetical protein
MKPIEPIQIWKNGQSQEANLLNAYIINDNLESACSFYYQLCSSSDEIGTIGYSLAEGNVSMLGEDYLSWDGDNNYAYTYIAQQLNLTLI